MTDDDDDDSPFHTIDIHHKGVQLHTRDYVIKARAAKPHRFIVNQRLAKDESFSRGKKQYQPRSYDNFSSDESGNMSWDEINEDIHNLGQ